MFAKFVSLFVAIALSALPAFADTYLIFAPGQDRSTDIWQGKPPVAGQNVSKESVVKPWVVVDGDTYPGNYKLENDAIVHSVPVIDVPPVDPNTPQWETFKTEIFLDSNINIVARLELSKLFPLMDSNIQNPAYIQQYWGALKQLAPVVPTYAWLDADTIKQVEAHAKERHIPFVAP